MLDTELAKNQAFQFITQQPEFSKNVLLLITELENLRFEKVRLEELLEDDAKIISGLVDHYKLLEKVAIAAHHYAEGHTQKEAFDEVWKEFVESIKSIAVPS